MSDGCRYYPQCETCPYPDCIIDFTPTNVAAMEKRAKARELTSNGLSISVVAEKLQVSERQVYRYLT